MATGPETRSGAIGITGGARGIGAALSLELARRGFTVGCLTRGARVPEGAPASMIGVECDVSDDASLHRAVDTLAARAGGLAGFINNAGIHNEGPSESIAMADFDRLMAVNSRAVFVGCRAAFPHLKALPEKEAGAETLGSGVGMMGTKPRAPAISQNWARGTPMEARSMSMARPASWRLPPGGGL